MAGTLSSIVCDLIVDIANDRSNENNLPMKNVIDEFYKIDHIVLVIFRGLCNTAQYLLYKVIMDMTKNGIPILNLKNYINDNEECCKNMKLAIDQLNALQLMVVYDTNKYLINESFCRNLLSFLFTYGYDDNGHEGIEQNNIDKINNSETRYNNNNSLRTEKERDVPFLRDYAKKRWNSVLNFVTQNYSVENINSCSVGYGAKYTTTQDIFQVLIFANIIEATNEENNSNKNDNGFDVTSEGFNFLLMPIDDQIRFYIANYLRYVYHINSLYIKENNNNNNQCINGFIQLVSFLCTIGHHNEAEPIHLNHTYPFVDCDHIRHFREIGLIYRKNSSSSLISLTYLALQSLSYGYIYKDMLQNDNSMIILETNLRLYLYNPTELHVALVGLFSEVLVYFPNLCVARITRESMQYAFRLGITSKQIISFIYNNMTKVTSWKLHLNQSLPTMVATNIGLVDGASKNINLIMDDNNNEWKTDKKDDYTNILPPTVVDQILIWEKEQHRLRHSAGILLDNFADQVAYDNVLKDIMTIDSQQLLYSNPTKRILILSTDNKSLVDKYNGKF